MIEEVAARAQYWMNSGVQMRKGQALMNALSEIDLETYREITGTEADPFYVDQNIGKFWSKLNEISK
jgi:hypothetical protein